MMKQRNRLSRMLAITLAVVMILTSMNFGMGEGTTLAWAETEDAETYLKTNYVDGTITTDTAVTKESDSVYAVSAKTASGYERTSLILRKVESTQYKVWYSIEKNDYEISIKRQAAGNCTLSVKVPENMFTLAVTLSVYDKAVLDADIKNGTAVPLATQVFTLKFAEKPKTYQVKIEPIDSESNSAIESAKITLYKDFSWNDITSTEGIYTLEEGTYKVDVEADGYQTIKGKEITPTSDRTIQIPMQKKAFSVITFSVKDQQGAMIDAPTITVKQGYYNTIKAQADGSYQLENGGAYSYTVGAKNYASVDGSVTPSGNQTIEVTLAKDIREYQVKFAAVSKKDGTAIDDAAISVTYNDYDWEEEDDVEIPVTPNTDGTYTLSKSEDYTITVTKTGYKTVTKSNYKPSGDSETYTETIQLTEDLPVAPEDQAKVDAAKQAFSGILGVLRPVYGTDTNIGEVVLAALKKQDASLDLEGVSVEVESTDDAERISTDGRIHYVDSDTLNSTGINFANVDCTFRIKCGNAEEKTGSQRVTIGWDRTHVEAKMQQESAALDEAKIKGENESLGAVEKTLVLPQILSNSARTAWSQITWESSNPDILAIEGTGYDTLLDAKAGKITAPETDQEVTLTATFKANDSILNSYVEKVSDFKTFQKAFKVTVKGTEAAKPTEESLQALLDKYYTVDSLSDFATKEKLDSNNCMGDIQLPRYTRIKDEAGDYVFNNREIIVTSDNTDVISVSGYRAAVDIFRSEDVVVNLIITFTREGVSVQKKIPITVRTITEEALDKEIEMMEYAKEHYFDGINEGLYQDAEHVTGNLHAFREFYLDQNQKPVWIYDIKNETGKGIFPDDFFTDSWEMEGAGYNKFKSSNPQIVRHDNLLVSRDSMPQKVTITSLLSSQRYGAFAEKHPDNEKLQKLYKQEVSVTIIVPGTDSSKTALNEKIKEAKSFLQTIVEGTAPGQYPAGTKQKLESAIADAEQCAGNEAATEQELTQAVLTLEETMESCARSQIKDTNPFTVSVSIKGIGTFKGLDTKQSNVVPQTDVWSVVKNVLDSNGYQYKIKSQGTIVYLESVTDPAGHTLAALDTPNSGWLYKVNGILPNVYMSQYKLSGNESVELYYTGDWRQDPAAGSWAGAPQQVVTSGTSGSAVTTSPTEGKVVEKTAEDGTKVKVAEVTVSADNQKEIIKQAKENKSAEIVLNVSKADVKDAVSADIKLDESFIDAIVKETDAKLTIKTPFGDKSYTQEELKTLSETAAGSTITVSIEKAAQPEDDAEEAAKIAEAKKLVAKLTPVARSAKTAKKNVKVTTSLDKQDKAIIQELKDAGYMVKYRFYRSTKKAAGYKAAITKKTTTYTNTTGKRGTKYFYKVQIRVYDQDGKLIAKTALKQCKYASRTWTR